MIRFKVFFKDDSIVGFELKGHSGYAEHGKDIVCSAVSVLAITAVNSIERLTEGIIKAETKDGYMKAKLISTDNCDAQLILKSMVLGLNMISEQYPDNVVITNKVTEV